MMGQIEKNDVAYDKITMEEGELKIYCRIYNFSISPTLFPHVYTFSLKGK
jgi:hypothetical protein